MSKAPEYELKLTPSGAPRFIFDVSPHWEQWILVTSDVHFDSQHCDRDALFNVLNQAVERDALWIDLGDWYDAMQSKSDKRRELDGIRPEYLYPSEENKRMGLWQRIVSDAEEKLQPYANRLIFAGLGNHETSCLRWSDINLTQELCGIAKRAGSTQCHLGSYTGYAHFSVRLRTKNEKKPGSSLTLWLTHGTGGNSPVTLGTIQSSRRMGYAPDARLYISGHIHQELMVTRTAIRSRPPVYTEKIEERHDITIPGFKQEFPLSGSPRNGWAIEKGFPPTPTGGLWIRLFLGNSADKGVRKRFKKELSYEVSWAKPL